jgi:hypothetical protein
VKLVLVAGTDTGDVALFHSRSNGTPILRDGTSGKDAFPIEQDERYLFSLWRLWSMADGG